MRPVVVIFIFLLAFAALANVATAQTMPATLPEVGLLDRVTIWIYQQQRAFHRELTDHLRELSNTGNWTVAFALVGASFLYGFFHAAGPGHGKAVMTGYLVTHRETVLRGIKLAVAAAFCQGLVAIIIVYGLVSLAGWLPRETQSAIVWSERASFALVALIGAFLLLRGARSLYRRLRASHQSSCRNGHSHDDEHDESCGHVHMPSANTVAAASDLKTMIGVVLSIGIRPCTGAVIVLVFAKAVSLAWVGVFAVLAMSAGTALAIGSMAAAAVGLRGAATRFAVAPPRYVGHAADIVAALGGILILVVGISLLSAAFGPSHPIMGG